MGRDDDTPHLSAYYPKELQMELMKCMLLVHVCSYGQLLILFGERVGILPMCILSVICQFEECSDHDGLGWVGLAWFAPATEEVVSLMHPLISLIGCLTLTLRL